MRVEGGGEGCGTGLEGVGFRVGELGGVVGHFGGRVGGMVLVEWILVWNGWVVGVSWESLLAGCSLVDVSLKLKVIGSSTACWIFLRRLEGRS